MTGPGRTVILGGGIGGIATANRLRRKAPRGHEIVLVDRNPTFSLAASYLWVMTGARKPEQISRPLDRLARRGIRVVIGEVENIDTTAHAARVSGESLEADNLVIALGADWSTDVVPGLAEHGHTYTTLPGAVRLAERLRQVDRGRVLVVTAAPLYKCPAAPYECALLVDSVLRGRGLGAAVAVAIHAAEPAPLGVAGPPVSRAVEAILAEREIPYQPAHQLTEVNAGVATFADGDQQPFDLLIYMPGIRPPAVLGPSGVANGAGWASADRATLATSVPGVFAIGDNTNIPLSIGKPLPRAGVFAHSQALVVADAIASRAEGHEPRRTFGGEGACFIETGDGRAGYGSGNFYAEPAPEVGMKPPSRRWHLGKVMFEKNVILRWL